MSDVEQSGVGESHAVGRRCAVVRENGEPCRGTPALGEMYCHAHERFRGAARYSAVLVPLMDDEASVTFVRSQTVRALAQGSIPPANGRAILEACRDAERRQEGRLAVQNAALRYAALAEKMGAGKVDGLLDRFVARVRQGAGELPTASGQRAENSDQRSVISEAEPASGQEPEHEEGAAGETEPEAAENPRAWWDALLRRIEEKAEKYRQEFRERDEEEARKAAAAAEWERKEAMRRGEMPATSDQAAENSDQRTANSEQAGIREQGSGIGGNDLPVSSDEPALSPTPGDNHPTAPSAGVPGTPDNHPTAPTAGASGAPEWGGAPGFTHPIRDDAADKGGAPEPEAVMHRSVFPGVKEEWDRALVRTGAEITKMVAPAEGESWYEFLAKKKEREAGIAAAG